MLDPTEYNLKRVKDGLFTPDQITELVLAFQQQYEDLDDDGKFGPMTSRRLYERMISPGNTHAEPSKLAETAVLVAISQLGEGETGWNNSGPAIHKYRDLPYDAAKPKRLYGEWCAFFVGYCFEEAAARRRLALPFQRRFMDNRYSRRMPIGGAKKLGRRIGEAGEYVTEPQRGDVIVWDRGKRGSPAGHIGIVERTENGIAHTIEGNVGRYPAKVRRIMRDLDRESRIEFFARV